MPKPYSTEAIWSEFHAQLFNFIRRRVRDDSLAQDLLQQVFLRIHTRIDTLRDESKLNAWIYQITRNVIADYYRAQSEQEPLDDEFPEPESEREDFAEQLAQGILNFVNTLPLSYREAFLLTEVEGMSQVELARRLGISVSGAKSRVQRARAKLKQMLLECCHFEFDRLGGLVNYYPRVDCCVHCRCDEALHPFENSFVSISEIQKEEK